MSFIIVLIGFVYAGTAYAQTITTLEPLDFGRSIVTNNDALYVLRVRPNNNLGRADPEFVIIEPPTRGLYLLTGAPPNTTITDVTVTVDTQMNGAGEDFRLGGFRPRFDPATDVNGELIVRLGARIRTTGNGNAYTPESSYNAVMTMNIIY